MLAEIRQREGVIVIRPTGRMIGAALENRLMRNAINLGAANAEIREQINEDGGAF